MEILCYTYIVVGRNTFFRKGKLRVIGGHKANGSRGFAGTAGLPKKMRKPRIYQEGIYYLTVKGNSHEFLFRDPADYEYFLNIIKTRKQKYNFRLYGYCLLPGRYHLLIETSPAANISKIMQALNTSYALYFNKKYQHIGHIVAGRFESRLINKDHSLIEIIRRIHLNPLQVKLTRELKDYKWSSFPEYLGTSVGLTDTDYVKTFGYTPETDRDYAVAAYRHLSLFKKYYLVPLSIILIFFIILQGQPRTERGHFPGNSNLKGTESVPFRIEKNYLALPEGLPQPKLAINLNSNAGLELPVGVQK